MQIKNFMTRKLVTVELDDTLEKIRDIFEHTRFHHLLVVEHKQLVGIISDRDLLRHVSPYLGTAVETNRDTATLQKRAHLIMTRYPQTLAPDASLKDALDKFTNQNVTCLPVIDADGRPVGIITWRDMLKLFGVLAAQSGFDKDSDAGSTDGRPLA